MNKSMIIGNLTKDPELKETSNGIKYCRFSVAVDRKFKGADGEKITDYFNVVTWRTTAENCHKYLKKGKKVWVCGEMQFRAYDDKDGIKRVASEISADEIEFLSPVEQQKDVPYSGNTKRKLNDDEYGDYDLPF